MNECGPCGSRRAYSAQSISLNADSIIRTEVRDRGFDAAGVLTQYAADMYSAHVYDSAPWRTCKGCREHAIVSKRAHRRLAFAAWACRRLYRAWEQRQAEHKAWGEALNGLPLGSLAP